MKQAVVDRFEGTMAVLVIDNQPVDVPAVKLPRGTREGDYLLVEMRNGEVVAAKHDEAATEAARQRIAEKLDRLRRGEHLSRDD